MMKHLLSIVLIFLGSGALVGLLYYIFPIEHVLLRQPEGIAVCMAALIGSFMSGVYLAPRRQEQK